MAESQKLKIAFVLDDGLDKPDGVQQYILSIGEYLRSKGHEVDFLVGQTMRRDLEKVYSMSKNIRVISNGNRMTIPLPTSYKMINKRLRQGRYDILHVQTPYSPFMGGRLIKKADESTAVIGTFHILPNNWLISVGNRLLGFYSNRTLRRFDKMLSVSPVAKDFALKTFRIDSDVLPNVVDYSRFKQASGFAKFTDNRLNILFLGRLVPRKGCITLLKAFNVLVHQNKISEEVRLIICGAGPEERNLKSYVSDSKLDKYVLFEGFIDEADKPKYYASADIAVFPSSGGESFGIVLIEAMSNGRTAVLAGDNPGYRSVLYQFPQSLFPAIDYINLAKRLEFLINNPKNRAELASQQNTYTKDFDINLVGKKLESIYFEALRKRRNQ